MKEKKDKITKEERKEKKRKGKEKEKKERKKVLKKGRKEETEWGERRRKELNHFLTPYLKINLKMDDGYRYKN